MTNYVELPFNKKLKLLRDHDLSDGWPNLECEKWCLHCRQKFSGHSARVWQDEAGCLWLECGTPDCDGSPIDWADYPWWNDRHPETKAYLRKTRRPKRKNSDDDIPL